MLSVSYAKIIPYSFEVVLSQYFDYEHVKYVHPHTLGEYRLVETRGNVIIYEQLWPRRFFVRRRSLVRQEFLPPNEIWFDFLKGLYRGVRVHSLLEEHADGTRVEETYHMRLPDWSWLRSLVSRSIVRKVEQIWEEDLRVKVCRGGWPGVPRQPCHSKKELDAPASHPC
jgi:hypothetical protein